jgi:hypothetical protein
MHDLFRNRNLSLYEIIQMAGMPTNDSKSTVYLRYLPQENLPQVTLLSLLSMPWRRLWYLQGLHHTPWMRMIWWALLILCDPALHYPKHDTYSPQGPFGEPFALGNRLERALSRSSHGTSSTQMLRITRMNLRMAAIRTIRVVAMSVSNRARTLTKRVCKHARIAACVLRMY